MDAVPYVELGLRTTRNSTIGMSPCNAVFGRNVFVCQKDDLGNTLKYQHKIKEIMKGMENQSVWIPRYAVGETVMIKSAENRFMKATYFGPAKIVRICENKMYKLKWKDKDIVRHESFLKPTQLPEANEIISESGNTSASSEKQRYPIRTRQPVDRFY